MNEVEESVVSYMVALQMALMAFKRLEENAGWFERPLLKLLGKSYRQRLTDLEGVTGRGAAPI